jgi:hypothetical protein
MQKHLVTAQPNERAIQSAQPTGSKWPKLADSRQAASENVTEESGHSSIALSGADVVGFHTSYKSALCTDRVRALGRSSSMSTGMGPAENGVIA